MPKIQAGTIEISYETYGDGEPLLLIMGLGLPGGMARQSAFLTQFKCIYFDNRGTGNSEKPEGPYTIPQLADHAGICSTRWAFIKQKSTDSRWAG